MKRMMVSMVLAAMAVAATPALASGSGSGGGGASAGGSNSFDPVLEQQRRLEQQARSQIKKRISCKTCQYKEGVTRQNAGAVAAAVRGGSFELTQKDREVVLAYLKQRYGV
ncbi:MAG: hypothetical protein H2049_04275 [Porphyrobacter sp.]|nr:hypothetical protein [Porphyrobacter sp.]